MYRLVRPLLFRMDAEAAHERVLSALQYLPEFLFPKPVEKPINVMGLEFPHPIGLAAGLDVDGEYLDGLAKLGFAFIELGTVTPKPQTGNPQPRLFRLPKARALVNRMGFNNAGVNALIHNVKAAHYRGILGINIGKNKNTPLDRAAEDYLYCLRKVFEHASYVTINISSPNTPDLRQLQQGEYFKDLMSQLREEQLHLVEKHQRYVPLVIKISPDESDETLKNMADVIVSQGIDGIIATNTSCDHGAVQDLPFGDEIGGVSGQPLVVRSTRCLKVLKAVVGDDVTLIGLGGIDRPRVARDKLKAGASLLQVYTGLIYKGPRLIRTLVKGIPE